VREFPPEIAPSAASLQQGPAAPVEMQTLAERIALALRQAAERGRSKGFPAILEAWRALDRTPGRQFHTRIGDAAVLGTAEGVDERGALLLRLPDGELISVTSASSLFDITSSSQHPVTTRPFQR
jgi:BirA family biotin operon repressor/biotin-[acetyl-CoA-carboxylase] ligase